MREQALTLHASRIRICIMVVKLENVVPWGRTLTEYRAMFALSDEDLGKPILGCSDGPASFNAEMTALGHSVVSVDPIYAFTAVQIEARVRETYPIIIEQVANKPDDFVWDVIKSPTELGELRMTAMHSFLADFEDGLGNGRYLPAELPHLPFEDSQFDLALCSHFLFLYSDHFDAEFHIASVRELLRIGNEVRIFPLLDLNGQSSAHLSTVVDTLRTDGFDVAIEKVGYEFQRGGNEMLKISNEA